MLRIVLGLVLAAWLSMTAHAGGRIALIVGNSDYQSLGALSNPVRDAELMDRSLRAVGFEVTTLLNASHSDFMRAIRDFGAALRDGGPDTTGLFYYAGHGVQSYGTNYLLPVDTALTNQADLDLVAIEAQSVLRQMFSARNATNIVILDACRDNPFVDIPAFNDNGLAEMQAPTGTFLAYATAPGAVAYDGEGDNSPFTSALAAELTTPGLPVEQMFKNVRVAVLDQTKGLQTPWDSSSLTRDFRFVEQVQPSLADSEEQRLWDVVRASRDPVQILLFVRAYPDSGFAPAARSLLAEAMAEEANSGVSAQASKSPMSDDPRTAEREMFEAAQKMASIASYELYLAEHPEGTYAELARMEVAALEAQSAKDPLAGIPDDQPPAEPEPAPEVTLPPVQGDITFDLALASGGANVAGRSIAQLIEGSPLFAPIEGLPIELWKGQSCSNCHEWNRDRLCEQGQFYLAREESRTISKLHPYGGGFKAGLRAWAANGCK